MTESLTKIMTLLAECTIEQKEFVFRQLRKEFNIHPLESKLNIDAELILEAINKDEKGLTLRMMRGVIAEAAFELMIARTLNAWKNETPQGDLPFDFLLNDGIEPIKVQVKLQRSKDLIPMLANQAYRRFSENQYVVETQKTRGGLDKSSNDTRPYRFGEFDILAVCMQPSSNDWSKFYFTVSDWLIPKEQGSNMMLKFQPVAQRPNSYWTDDFDVCVSWLRSRLKRTIPL